MQEKHFHPVSIHLSAPVWNILVLPEASLVAIEQRDELKRLASFSLYHYRDEKFLWRDVVLPEKWWINLVNVTQEFMVLKVFESTENPDKTSLRFLSVEDGCVTNPPPEEITNTHTNGVLYPFQYLDGEPDYATVTKFLAGKFEVTPRLGVEYLEHNDHVFISYYVGQPAAYTNKLALFNTHGNCLYEEEIGTNLKGIGINTFFISSDYLFFVKNKTELVTFRIV